MTALVLVGCGSSTAVRSDTTGAGSGATAPHAHPQVVEPVAGQGGGHTATQLAQAGEAAPPLHDPAPNVAASNTSAVAKGAPSDAEVRAAIAKFQAAVQTYHLDRLNLSYALLNPADLPRGQWYQSIASVFTDYGLPIACGGVLHVPQLGVANKTLPCGTEILFEYGGRAIKVPVIDRGPYIAGREWDLTGATAEALHFPGLGPINWRIVSR
ncbi:MAG TPA: RlpA-like double-psi beta-barrel domain-containing protein [Solirubrobacteraceae bacterium]|jgi:rare lipoprotein A (peptidoglycan hydrolase)